MGMEFTLRFRSRFYFFGILSLAVLAILFVWRTNKLAIDKKEHCIKMAFVHGPRVDLDPRDDPAFQKRNNYTIYLSGDRQNDSLSLILIEHFSRGIHLSKNELVGIKVVFSGNPKYATYVGLLNACLKSGVSDWIPLGDTLFVFQRNLPALYGCKDAQNSASIELYPY